MQALGTCLLSASNCLKQLTHEGPMCRTRLLDWHSSLAAGQKSPCPLMCHKPILHWHYPAPLETWRWSLLAPVLAHPHSAECMDTSPAMSVRQKKEHTGHIGGTLCVEDTTFIRVGKSAALAHRSSRCHVWERLIVFYLQLSSRQVGSTNRIRKYSFIDFCKTKSFNWCRLCLHITWCVLISSQTQ